MSVTGVPDMYNGLTFVQHYQTLDRVGAAGGATGTWEGTMVMLPHPVCFASYITTDTTGDTHFISLNSQLGSPTTYIALNNFTASVLEWRLMYAGLTMIQDGAALTDQGAIAVCQTTIPMETFNVSFKNSTPAWVGVDHVTSFFSNAVPTFNETVNMSTCYQGPSKQGVYIPLKLSEEAVR